jgi:uncharacterized Zn finger protein (UPF0148 family)
MTMNKVCRNCGHSGENVWRNGTYHCAMCDAEIDMTAPDAYDKYETVDARQSGGNIYLNAVCPICKNEKGNYMNSGKGYCALCGSEIPINRSNDGYNNNYSNNNSRPANSGSRGAKSSWDEEREKEKKNSLVLGIVFLFVFWPVGIYFLWKYFTM